MSFALLCPGQGGQHPGMFAPIAGNGPAGAVLDGAARVLGVPPIELAAQPETIFRNRIAQPLVCAAILGRWAALETRLPRPSMVLGYSVGELAAHAIAGTFAIETCLRLAQQRADCMDAASPPGGGLVAVQGLSRTQVEALCTALGVAVAIVNGPDHVVLGGPGNALDAAEAQVRSLGARAVRLAVSVPAHTRWLTDAAEAFGRVLAATPMRSPMCPVLAGIDGRPVMAADKAAFTLAAQIAQTIQWQACMTQATERGATVLLELGPGSALTRIARTLYPNCVVRSVDDFGSLDGVVAWVERATTDL